MKDVYKLETMNLLSNVDISIEDKMKCLEVLDKFSEENLLNVLAFWGTFPDKIKPFLDIALKKAHALKEGRSDYQEIFELEASTMEA